MEGKSVQNVDLFNKNSPIPIYSRRWTSNLRVWHIREFQCTKNFSAL